MATRINLEFSLGETWEIELDCKDAAGAALDLDGGDVKWRVCSKTEKLLDLASGSGVTIDADPTTGRATLTVTPEMQTAGNLTAGTFDHEARAILADGSVSEQAYGVLTARRSLFAAFT